MCRARRPVSLRRRPVVLVVSVVSALVASAMVTQASPAMSLPTPEGPRSLYVVQFDAEPLASFGGGGGFAATSPKVTGRKLDVRSAAARRWSGHLDGLQTQVLAAAGVDNAPIAYNYRTALSGFAARLTAAEAARLQAAPGVASVSRSRMLYRNHRPQDRHETNTTSSQRFAESTERRALVGGAGEGNGANTITAPPPRIGSTITASDTSAAGATPPTFAAAVDSQSDDDLSGDVADFLGLPEGLWARLGGPDHAGEDVVIGVIDDGIVVDHPSFADKAVVDGVRNYIGPDYEPLESWNGACQTGPRFPACNNKVIGARNFFEGIGADNVIGGLTPYSSGGHGAEVTGIAAGNYGVNPTLLGNDLGVGIISGVAPRARIAAYKVFWPTLDDVTGGTATDVDITAGIDAAVADGVDVINLSLGIVGANTLIGGSNLVTGPDNTATLRAFDAGVAVVAAIGNNGPGLLSAGNPGRLPWILGVGASTTARTFETVATFSDPPDGDTFILRGESLTAGLDTVPLVAGRAIPAPGADPADSARCRPSSLDPAAAAGKAIVCETTAFGFVETAEVAAAGGVGAVLFGSEFFRGGPAFVIPTVVLALSDLGTVTDFLASASSPMLSLAPAAAASAVGDRVGNFSSRGPGISRDERFLGQPSGVAFVVPEFTKPDVVAPGEELLVATTPDFFCPGCEPHESYTTGTGTSAASPATAGAAALLLHLRPGQSPAAIKSALTTTATPEVTLYDGVNPATSDDAGTGRIDPTRAADPGLVLESAADDYLRYVEGADPRVVPKHPKPIEPRDLNLPSIGFEFLAGQRPVQRTFTSVDARAAQWAVSFEGLPGLTASATPGTFTVRPGRSQTIDFTFEPTGAPLFSTVFGAVVLTNTSDGRTLRLPVRIVPGDYNIVVPHVDAHSPSGHAPAVIEAGVSAVLSVTGTGLAAPNTRRGEAIGQGEVPLTSATQGLGLNVYDIPVPTGAQLLQVQTDNVDGGTFLSELNLHVLRDDDHDGFEFPDDLVASSAFSGGGESVGVAHPPAALYRVLVHGVDPADPVGTYDFTTWIIADSSPDDLSSPIGPALQVTGDPRAVQPGDTVTFDLKFARLSTPGIHLGIVTFYDTATPTPGRELSQRIIEFSYNPPTLNGRHNRPPTPAAAPMAASARGWKTRASPSVW